MDEIVRPPSNGPSGVQNHHFAADETNRTGKDFIHMQPLAALHDGRAPFLSFARCWLVDCSHGSPDHEVGSREHLREGVRKRRVVADPA